MNKDFLYKFYSQLSFICTIFPDMNQQMNIKQKNNKGNLTSFNMIIQYLFYLKGCTRNFQMYYKYNSTKFTKRYGP